MVAEKILNGTQKDIMNRRKRLKKQKEAEAAEAAKAKNKKPKKVRFKIHSTKSAPAKLVKH